MSEIAPIRQRRARRALLTDIGVSKLPRKPKPYFHPDPQLVGHRVRVRPSGPGAFTVIVRDPYKRQRWVKVGSTDAFRSAGFGGSSAAASRMGAPPATVAINRFPSSVCASSHVPEQPVDVVPA